MPFILQPGLGYRPAPGVSASAHWRNLRAYLWQKSGGLCALCGVAMEPADVHADHVVPRSRGGTDGVDNLQATHQSCNSRKNNRTNAEAIAWIRAGAAYERRVKTAVHVPRKARMWTPAMLGRLFRMSPFDAVRFLQTAGVPYIQLGGGWRGRRVLRTELQRFIDSRRTDP